MVKRYHSGIAKTMQSSAMIKVSSLENSGGRESGSSSPTLIEMAAFVTIGTILPGIDRYSWEEPGHQHTWVGVKQGVL